MYQQINLYQPIFRKQRQIFSAVTMFQAIGVVAAALLADLRLRARASPGARRRGRAARRARDRVDGAADAYRSGVERESPRGARGRCQAPERYAGRSATAHRRVARPTARAHGRLLGLPRGAGAPAHAGAVAHRVRDQRWHGGDRDLGQDSGARARAGIHAAAWARRPRSRASSSTASKSSSTPRRANRRSAQRVERHSGSADSGGREQP